MNSKMNRKADGRVFPWIFATLILIFLIPAYFLGIQSLGLEEATYTINTAGEVQQTQRILSIVRTNADEIVESRYEKLKQALESEYSKDVKCNFWANNELKDSGCGIVDKKSTEVKLDLPKYDGSIIKIKLEVVEQWTKKVMITQH